MRVSDVQLMESAVVLRSVMARLLGWGDSIVTQAPMMTFLLCNNVPVLWSPLTVMASEDCWRTDNRNIKLSPGLFDQCCSWYQAVQWLCTFVTFKEGRLLDKIGYCQFTFWPKLEYCHYIISVQFMQTLHLCQKAYTIIPTIYWSSRYLICERNCCPLQSTGPCDSFICQHSSKYLFYFIYLYGLGVFFDSGLDLDWGLGLTITMVFKPLINYHFVNVKRVHCRLFWSLLLIFPINCMSSWS